MKLLANHTNQISEHHLQVQCTIRSFGRQEVKKIAYIYMRLVKGHFSILTTHLGLQKPIKNQIESKILPTFDVLQLH